MSTSSPLDTALSRLAAALARLDDALERRTDADRKAAGHDIEVQALSDDRARLAEELDESFARSARLETATREVSRRLDEAIDSIRLVVNSHGQH
jgi:hypothetical protein